MSKLYFPFIFLIIQVFSIVNCLSKVQQGLERPEIGEKSFTEVNGLYCEYTGCVDSSSRPKDQDKCTIYSFPCFISPVSKKIYWKCCTSLFSARNDIQEEILSSPLRIVGGNEAEPKQFPYQVSLQNYETSPTIFCGGSIYNNEYVITAAHCLEKISTSKLHYIRVSAGDLKLDMFDEGEQQVDVENIIIHPLYDSSSAANDIALIKLKTPLTFTDFVKPIALPPASYKATGSAYVSGWGSTEMWGMASNHLMYTKVDIISDDYCTGTYSNFKETMICASNPYHGPCNGDSGGPLVCQIQGYPYLCGIVSYGRGCAIPDYPGSYTEVSHFISWIKNKAV